MAVLTVKTAAQSGAGVSVPIPTIVGRTSLFDAVNQALQQADDCVTQTDPTCAAIVQDLEIRDQNNIVDFVNGLTDGAIQQAGNCVTQTDPTCALVVRTVQQQAQSIESTATSCLNGTNDTCNQLISTVGGEVAALATFATQCVNGQNSTCAALLTTLSQVLGEAVTCLLGVGPAAQPADSGPLPDCQQAKDLAFQLAATLEATGLQLAAIVEGTAVGALGNVKPVCTTFDPSSADFENCLTDFVLYKSKPAISVSATTNLTTNPDDAGIDPAPVTGGSDSGASTDIANVESAVIADLTANDLAQVEPTDTATKIASATDPSAVAARAAEMGNAWAPDVLASHISDMEDAYAYDVRDPNSIPMLDARFTVVQWQGVQVSGSAATATVVASEGLRFADDPTSWNDNAPEQYVVHLSLSGGRWLMEDFSATSEGGM